MRPGLDCNHGDASKKSVGCDALILASASLLVLTAKLSPVITHRHQTGAVSHKPILGLTAVVTLGTRYALTVEFSSVAAASMASPPCETQTAGAWTRTDTMHGYGRAHMDTERSA